MLQPGSQIGRYEIQRRLGRGGMGTVYVAHDPVLGRLVAIKVFATDLELPDAAQRFAKEARSAATLNHPNIVTVHDYGDVESQPYIVMEYVQGDTLADIIRRKVPVPLTEKLRWLEELCAGLAYAHRNGVLHRDIKPTNLMSSRSGQLKILDFGIARMMGTLSPKATALVGTPGYMAPEQILGEALDNRADLFSIGVVAYELLAYTEAFPGDTLPTITHRILNQAPVALQQLIPDLHPDLVALIDRALRKDPKERFDDAETMHAAISKIRRHLENDATWDATAPTKIVDRPGGGVSKRGTGSERRLTSDSVGVAQMTPPPEPRADREMLARRRTEQIEACLERSRTFLNAGDTGAALEACIQALTLEENHPGAVELEQAINTAIAVRRAEDLRQEAAGELGRFELTSAQGLLQQARELEPESADLKRLERDLKLARVEQTRQRQRAEALAAAIEKAERALRDGETEVALASARDALSLDGGSAKARELEAEALRRIDEDTAQILRVDDKGRIATPPPMTVLSPRGMAARPAETDTDVPPTMMVPGRKPATPVPVVPAIEAKVTPPPAPTMKMPAPAPTPAPTVRVPPPPAAKPSAPVAKAPAKPAGPKGDVGGELKKSLAETTASARAAWLARPAKQRAMIGWGALGLVAVAVIAIVAIALQPGVAPTGVATLDALPWATVTRIEAEDGTVQALPEEASTPLALTLPEGTYKVTLTGPPPASESRIVTVQVQGGVTAAPMLERFTPMTLEQYFDPYLTSSTPAAGGDVPAAGDPAAPPASGGSPAPGQGAPQ